ncbi:MAG: cobyrinate a,c-diamide synthase [Deltaproteobacteria bacterium]|nr:cobyrinate a,c-diamide synthase [Deltaproteobacteria bacterium]MBW2137395.1 cobyrinate a,c-diamide synthase [Deltaproteobacteria bacterium]
MISSVCIAGTQSGCGKTIVSLGIMAALVRRGLRVQPFKVGPDFIDPGHHRRVTGRDCHNLDGWMIGLEYCEHIFSRYTRDADAAVVEGVMGLFDGVSGESQEGSTAEMAKHLGIPVILVIDARSMARSCAALAMGFSSFDPELPLKGVIFNRVGSDAHREFLRRAMDSALPDLPVLGGLPREEDLEIPSRHLGLVTDEDNPLDQEGIDRLAQWVERALDLDRILDETRVHGSTRGTDLQQDIPRQSEQGSVPIGIAMDRAFTFYYPENLRLLREAGARLVPFSPLRDTGLPHGVKGLILGGGYPELYCRDLAANGQMLREIKEFAMSGGPVYAECGGFMLLTNGITDKEGREHRLVGLFPANAEMRPKLQALGYREVRTRERTLLGSRGTVSRGHEFHYSDVKDMPSSVRRVYEVGDRRHPGSRPEGFMLERTLGSYIHLHWGSNPDIAGSFVEYCGK